MNLDSITVKYYSSAPCGTTGVLHVIHTNLRVWCRLEPFLYLENRRKTANSRYFLLPDFSSPWVQLELSSFSGRGRGASSKETLEYFWFDALVLLFEGPVWVGVEGVHYLGAISTLRVLKRALIASLKKELVNNSHHYKSIIASAYDCSKLLKHGRSSLTTRFKLWYHS